MTDRPTAPVQDDDAELWAVLYLHDWDEPKEGKQPIYPEIHGVFSTWQEAEAEVKSKSSPEKYSVRRAKNFTRSRLSPTPDTGLIEALSESLFALSDKLRASGVLSASDAAHAAYERVVADFTALANASPAQPGGNVKDWGAPDHIRFDLVVATINRRLGIYREKRDAANPLGEDCYSRHDAFTHTVEAIEILADEAGLADVVPLEPDPGSRRASRPNQATKGDGR